MSFVKKAPKDEIDPLYVIFEQHLYNFQDSELDRKTFIGNIISEYFAYLRQKKIVVPKSLEPAIAEELYAQINTMLVKKIYGCLSIQEYREKALGSKKPARAAKARARQRYTRLKKTA